MDEYISKQTVIDYLNGYLHSLGDGGADTLLFDRGQRRALINAIQDISAVKATDFLKVLQQLYDTCEGTRFCMDCEFYSRHTGMCVFNDMPRFWNLNEIEKALKEGEENG